MRWIVIQLVFLLSAIDVCAQSDYFWSRLGDKSYREYSYEKAEEAYRKAEEEKARPSTKYNLANTIYQQNRFNEAIEAYQDGIKQTTDPSLQAKGYYNLGNAYFQQQKWKESVQAYKESLKRDPSDQAAKQNLTQALRQLQQQQQQQDQQDQNQQQQKQQQNQQQQNQNNQPQQNQPQPQSQDGKGQTGELTPVDQRNQSPVSPEQAKEMLKVIEREDQKTQEKLRKGNPASSQSKPW